MVDFHRENQGDSEFEACLTEHPDGWRCTVQRGGNVSLSGGPFKGEAAARAWCRVAVTGLLKAALEAQRAERPADQIVDGFDYDAPALEGERECIHCGHTEGEHRIDGNCDVFDASGFLFDARPRCPCTCFDPPLEAGTAATASAEVR